MPHAGEWHVESGHWAPEGEQKWLIDGVMRDKYGNNSISGNDKATCEFIAAAPADVDWLLAEVKALRRALAAEDKADFERLWQEAEGRLEALQRQRDELAAANERLAGENEQWWREWDARHGQREERHEALGNGLLNRSGLQRRCFDECETAGWDPDKANSFAEEIAHLHEEVSEAFREWRLHKDYEIRREPDGKPTGIPIELADVMIGLFYNAELHGFDLLEAFEIKHRWNLARNYQAEGRALHPAAAAVPGMPQPTEER